MLPPKPSKFLPFQDELKKVGHQLERERAKSKAMARKMMESNERNTGEWQDFWHVLTIIEFFWAEVLVLA